MSVPIQSLGTDEPPPAGAASLSDKISRAALLVLCAGPIILFPVALALRIARHYFP